MVVALKPSNRSAEHDEHRRRCNHWKGRIDHERGPDGNTFAMQCSMLDHLTEFSSVFRAELAEDVAGDFGSFDMRSFHRNLAKLIKYGWVAKDEEFDLSTGRMEFAYRRLRRDDPPRPRRRVRTPPFAPLNKNPVGPWPGYLVFVVAPAGRILGPTRHPTFFGLAKIKGSISRYRRG